MTGASDAARGAFRTLSCVRRPVEGAVCLSLSGEVDLGNVASLRVHLQTAAETGDNVVVDVSGLRYLDSQGLQALLDARTACLHHGRRIVLAAPSPMVHRLLQIAGLEEIIPVFPGVDAAVSSLRDA